MANRFLETNFFKSPFVRKLKGELKALYAFVICDCTPSGIWFLDLDAANLYIGFKISIDDFSLHFIETGKAVDIGGGKYFFPDFIEHQYPKGLISGHNAHKGIIDELRKLGLIDENLKLNKTLTRPKVDPNLPQTRGTGNGYGNGLGNKEGGMGEEKFIAPQMVSIFKQAYPSYQIEQDSDFSSCLTIAYKIAKMKDWGRDSVLNGNMDECLESWRKIVDFTKGDTWFSSRSLSDISTTKEWQRLIQSMNKNGTHKQASRRNSKSEGVDKVLDRLREEISTDTAGAKGS